MKLKQFLAIAATFACATAAHAQSAGSVVLNVGWFHLSPQSSSDPLEIVSSGGHTYDAYVTGTGASVKAADTLGLSAQYFFTDHIATELVGGIAPKFELDGAGSLSSLGKLGTVKQWSPALLLKYYFAQANSTVRPFLGLGVSRVWFTDGTITNSTLNTLLGGQTSVSSIKNSWAPVFNGGLVYNFNKHWSAALSISYLPLSTTGQFSSTNASTGAVTISQTKITLNPIVSFLSVGYTF
jgi:outer membrane protein